MTAYDGLVRNCQLRHEQQTARRHLRRAGRRLTHTAQLGSRFLTGVDRRLQAPLGTVLKVSRKLRRRVFNPVGSHRLETLLAVRRDNARLLSLVGSVLSMTGVRSKRIRLRLTPMTITPLYQSDLTFIGRRTLGGRVNLRARVTSKLPPF